MRRDRHRATLFWKLLLALCVSMLLSIVAALAYFRYSIGVLDHPPPGLQTIGPLPLVPLVTGMVAMVLVGGAVAWYLAVPLRLLSQGLRTVAQGRFDARVGPLLKGRRDEIADLAADFDSMAEQLQRLSQSRQTLMHDISHELRSPLARMQVAIGLMRQDPAQTEAMVDRIEKESDRLDVLVEELLTFHRLEAAPESWRADHIDVLDLLHGITEDADFEARTRGRQVSIEASVAFVAYGRGELLYRAYENVIRNAVKYTAEGTVVEVAARVDEADDRLIVTVADRGPGVPDADHGIMFEPFTRLDASQAVRGAGLGLAIARRALRLHDGTITASQRMGGGLVMTIGLPRRTKAS